MLSSHEDGRENFLLTGFLYLAVVLDAFSRRIVGWAMGHSLKTQLVLDALNMAIEQRKPSDVIHHSDQGSQYTSIAFGNRCRQAGVRPSMGSVGDCYDNAMCESFFATLECELLDRRRFRSRRSMLQLSFTIEPNDEGIFDGLELARGLIAQAFQLVAPYVDHCPACADNLFTVIANEEMGLLHAEREKTGTLAGTVMGLEKEGVDQQEAMARHVEATTGRTQALLEKAADYNPHEHGG